MAPEATEHPDAWGPGARWAVPRASLGAFLWSPRSEGPSGWAGASRQIGSQRGGPGVFSGGAARGRLGQAAGAPSPGEAVAASAVTAPTGARGKDPLDSERTCALQTDVLKSKFFIAALFLKF